MQIRRSRTFSPTLMIIFLVLFNTNLYKIASGQETTVPVKLVTVVWAPHFFAFLPKNDIHLINLPTTNVTDALDKHEISAGYTFQPYTQT